MFAPLSEVWTGDRRSAWPNIHQGMQKFECVWDRSRYSYFQLWLASVFSWTTQKQGCRTSLSQSTYYNSIPYFNIESYIFFRVANIIQNISEYLDHRLTHKRSLVQAPLKAAKISAFVIHVGTQNYSTKIGSSDLFGDMRKSRRDLSGSRSSELNAQVVRQKAASNSVRFLKGEHYFFPSTRNNLTKFCDSLNSERMYEYMQNVLKRPK